MIYEEYAAVGEVTNMKTYKGSPEDIAKLLEYQNDKTERVQNISLTCANNSDSISNKITNAIDEMHKGEKILRQG